MKTPKSSAVSVVGRLLSTVEVTALIKMVLSSLQIMATFFPSKNNIMAIRRPFNLNQWIKDNRDTLKPPVGNKNLYVDAGDYFVMIVGGPNARKDYHYNETEELFYQLEGEILVKIQEDGKSVDVPIKAGEMFLLPAKVPHSPIRPEGSVGLVIECKRPNLTDGLLWFCDSCNHKLHETYFTLDNIEKDFFPRFREFYGSVDMRTCDNCGTVMQADKRFMD